MFKRITHTFIHVLDQDEALDFYVGKLGMVVHPDADLGFMRWLTVALREQPDFELGLMLPDRLPTTTRPPSRSAGLWPRAEPAEA